MRYASPMRFERYKVRNLYSVAHLFPRRSRTGIYVLEFADGQRYVGQAVDVVTRFGAHRRRWSDIEALEFSPCPRGALDLREERAIRDQQRRECILRNVRLALGPVSESDLDPLVTLQQQHDWLSDGESDLKDLPRKVDREQRKRTAGKYLELAGLPSFPRTAKVLNLWVQKTIPRPCATERTFWCLSAVPSTKRIKGRRRLATLSINKMEVLWIEIVDDPQPWGVRVNLSKKALERQVGSLSSWARQLPDGVELYDVDYESAGGDGLGLDLVEDAVFATLRRDEVIRAARAFNLMLMRKGPTLLWRNHCYDLADWAIEVSPRALNARLRALA